MVHAVQHSTPDKANRRLKTSFLMVWQRAQICVLRYDLQKGTDHSGAETGADLGIRTRGRRFVHVEVSDAVIHPDHQQLVAHREHDGPDEQTDQPFCRHPA